MELFACVTRTTTLLALDIVLKHFFSQSTSAYSALGALAIMRYTNLRFTYLPILTSTEPLKSHKEPKLHLLARPLW